MPGEFIGVIPSFTARPDLARIEKKYPSGISTDKPVGIALISPDFIIIDSSQQDLSKIVCI